MDSELASLEEKIGQTVALCQRLRAENVDLRQQLAAAQNDGKRLTDKVEGARIRLETILQKIPG
jgi:cell division protein ZapB